MEKIKKTTVIVDGYELSHENGTKLQCKRDGKEWRNLTGDKLVLSLAMRIEELEKEMQELKEERGI